MHDTTVHITEKLHLNVTWLLDVLLKVHGITAEVF
jgi:hypothetical protein